MQPDQMTSPEVCELLGIDRSTLTRRVQAGRIEPAFKLPGRNGAYVFDRATVEALAAERAEVAR